ncbi:MAG: alanine racemase [Mogibacterium sp.]|nr:alanine racemase [Mogibacterium sp.]
MLKVQDLVGISKQINTPAYVFSAGEFKTRAEQTTEILGPDVNICYSIKANPFLLSALPDEFSKVEVCSPGELSICMALRVDPEMIIYSGLNKGPEDVASAVDYGVGVLTAESSLHLKYINEAAAQRGVKAKVLARASAGSQFGIDRHELPSVLAAHADYPNIEFVGLHFFTGTQKRKSKEVIKELNYLERYIDELREASGLALPRIEYGAGLPAYMFCDSDLKTQDDAWAAELDMLREIAEPLRQLAKKSELTVEMGRFFAASCGHYFSRVVDSKVNDGVRYVIIDGGSHQVRYYGQMQGMQLPFTDIADPDEVGKEPVAAASDNDGWTVCGSLCTTADVLARNVDYHRSEFAGGEVLVFHQAGAYSLYECMSLFLSRDMPSIYIMESDGSLKEYRSRIDTDIFNRQQ